MLYKHSLPFQNVCLFTLILHGLKLLNLYNWNDLSACPLCWPALISYDRLCKKTPLEEETALLTHVQRLQSMAVWLHGLWACGQLGHHGEAHACGGAKRTISWCRGSQRTDRRKSPDRLDSLRPCRPEPTSLLWLSSWSFHCLPTAH